MLLRFSSLIKTKKFLIAYVRGFNKRPQVKFNPVPFEYHTELELIIDGIDEVGRGYAYVDNHRITVPSTIPGEHVIGRIFKNMSTHSEADLVEILKPSETRVVPKCVYYDVCGGCQFQHMSMSSQLEWKRNRVRMLMGIVNDPTVVVNEAVSTNNHYHYRSKITPHYTNPRKYTDIGFQTKSSSKVVDIAECVLATEAINEAYSLAREALHKQFLKEKPRKGATLLFRDVCGENTVVETDNRAIVTQRVGKMDFRYRAGEFFQTNPFMLPLLVEHVVHWASSYGCAHLIDAYCGCGLFSISAASKFSEVIGIEISQPSTILARENALLNNVQNTTFSCGSVENLFQVAVHLDALNTVVVIDPPRKGCTGDFLRQLFDFSPRVIVYVACDPATQARDAKLIVEAGYSIDDVTPFDMFPHTKHIENVIVFSQK